MDWEIVMLGEIIQREKDKYDCLYVESKKKMVQMNLSTKQKQRHRYRKQANGY